MADILENTLRIKSHLDLENEMCRYNCKTAEELEDFLWHNYGVTVIIDCKIGV